MDANYELTLADQTAIISTSEAGVSSVAFISDLTALEQVNLGNFMNLVLQLGEKYIEKKQPLKKAETIENKKLNE